MTHEEAVYTLKNTAWLGAASDLAKVEEAIKTLEAAEPVRCGRWNDMRESSKDVPHIECSACGKPVYTAIRYAYCPNCGSRMEGQE